MKNISVIVPVYYGEKYIPDIIHQIERCKGYLESEDHFEIIFINDAPDAPLSLDWKSEIIHVIIMNTDENVGIHGARIKGFQRCRGEYVLFLDQDDKILPEYFYSQFTIMKDNDAVICKAIDSGENFYPDDNIFQNIISKEYMLGKWNHIISPGQVLLKKKSVPEIWCENILKYNGADDWLLWLCMLAKGCSFVLNPEILYEHVSHERNASDNILTMVQSQQEVIGIVQETGIFSGKDLSLLLNAFFARYTNWIWELDVLRRKFYVLERWMKLRENGVKLAEYLNRSGVRKCAIYGCGIMGEHIYAELKDEIKIEYFIDRNAAFIKKDIPIYSLEDTLPKVDIIIITLLKEAEPMEQKIKEKSSVETLILTDWLAESSVNGRVFSNDNEAVK